MTSNVVNRRYNLRNTGIKSRLSKHDFQLRQ